MLSLCFGMCYILFVNIVISLLVSTISVLAATYILSGVSVDSVITAFAVAVLLGVVNAFVKPVVYFLTLPITIITLGLFALVINALMVLLVDVFVQGFQVESFLWAIAFSIVVSVVSALLGFLKK